MQDGDLPAAVDSFSGHFRQILIATSPSLTILKSNSFPGLSFDQVYFEKNVNLETVEENFLQGGEVATIIDIYQCHSLR